MGPIKLCNGHQSSNRPVASPTPGSRPVCGRRSRSLAAPAPSLESLSAEGKAKVGRPQIWYLKTAIEYFKLSIDNLDAVEICVRLCYKLNTIYDIWHISCITIWLRLKLWLQICKHKTKTWTHDFAGRCIFIQILCECFLLLYYKSENHYPQMERNPKPLSSKSSSILCQKSVIAARTNRALLYMRLQFRVSLMKNVIFLHN